MVSSSVVLNMINITFEVQSLPHRKQSASITNIHHVTLCKETIAHVKP
jgi:hypothetical protein